MKTKAQFPRTSGMQWGGSKRKCAATSDFLKKFFNQNDLKINNPMMHLKALGKQDQKLWTVRNSNDF